MARKNSRTRPRPHARARPPEEEFAANLFLGVLLFFLAVLVFYPVFNAGFVWDDDQLLTVNPQVHSPDGWWMLWLKPQTADYFPLTSLTLWVEYHLGQIYQGGQGDFFKLWNVEFLQRNAGADFWSGYHITNVLFHATAVVLTWQTLKRLKIPGAWIAAAIFAVHPVCVESVAWISERKNTISQIFFLLSIIHYVRFEEKGRTWRYVAAVICFTLSLLAKTSVVMLPFILLLLAWWRYKDLKPLRPSYGLEENPTERGILLWSCVAAGVIFGGAGFIKSPALGVAGVVVGGGVGYVVGEQVRRIRKWSSFAGFEVIRMLPFFLVAFLLGLVTVYFQYGRAIGGEEIPIGNLWQRSVSACFAAGFYLYSAFWPFNLIEIYPQWHRAFSLLVTEPKPHWDPPAPEAISYWMQVIPGLVIAGLLAYCWVRRTENWARALLVGLGSYILAMLPALGLLTMSYMRLTLVADHFQYISIIAVIALVVAAGYTRSMKPLWLLIAAGAFALISYLNWNQTQDNHVAEIIWIAGVLVLAAASMVRDIWKYVWGGFLGAVLICFFVISMGQAEIYHGEKTLWTATLEKNPYSWQAHNHLGAALYMEGNWREAGPHFLRATQLKPENPESHNNLGLYYSMEKDMPDAIHQYEMAVGIKEDASMETNLANAYVQVGRLGDAIKAYRKAIELSPELAAPHCYVGIALFQSGSMDEAIPELMTTIKLDPRMPQGPAFLDRALRAKGIDPSAPPPPSEWKGKYSFDVEEALRLLKSAPRRPAGPSMQQ